MSGLWKKLAKFLLGEQPEPGPPVGSPRRSSTAHQSSESPSDPSTDEMAVNPMEEADQTPRIDAPPKSPDPDMHDIVGKLIGALETHLVPLAEQSGRTEAVVQRLTGMIEDQRQQMAAMEPNSAVAASALEDLTARVDAFEQRLADAFSDTQQTQDTLSQIVDGLEAVRQSSEASSVPCEKMHAALERLARWDESHDGKLASLLEQSESSANTVQRIREIIAALPEIATGQTEILDDLRQSVSTIEARSEKTRVAMAKLVAEVGQTKALLSELTRAIASCQETTTDLSATQKKVVEVINALNKRTAQLAEIARQNAQAVRELADTNQSMKHELGERISKATGSLATKATLSLILSAIAAIAALAAAAAAFLL